MQWPDGELRTTGSVVYCRDPVAEGRPILTLTGRFR